VSGNHRLEDNKAEQERIKGQGFEVSSSRVEGRPCGPLRVWPGGLAMGRTLGDFDVRPASQHPSGLTGQGTIGVLQIGLSILFSLKWNVPKAWGRGLIPPTLAPALGTKEFSPGGDC